LHHYQVEEEDMPLKKGDIIDERKHHPESCGLMIKVMAGGEGFEKVVCCGGELTEDDVVPVFTRSRAYNLLKAGSAIHDHDAQATGIRMKFFLV